MCTVVILSIYSHTVPKAMCNNSKSGGVKHHNKRMVLGGLTYHRYSGRCAYLLQTIKNGDGGLVCVCVCMCVCGGGGGAPGGRTECSCCTTVPEWHRYDPQHRWRALGGLILEIGEVADGSSGSR